MIDSLDKIHNIATSGKGRPGLADELLAEVVTSFGAESGIIWSLGAAIEVVATHSRTDAPPSVRMRQADHEKLLESAASSAIPLTYRVECPDEADRPLLLVGRFADAEGPCLLELILDGNANETAGLDALRERFRGTLTHVTATASATRGVSDAGRGAVSYPIGFEALHDYARRVNATNELSLAAANIANESRRVLDCDRVSVVAEKSGRLQLLSISGQTSVNRRSNTSRSLEALTLAVLKAKRELWLPEEDELPGPISRALEEYAAASSVRSLVIKPVFESNRIAEEDDENSGASVPQRVLGGVVYEHFSERLDREAWEPRIDLLQTHAANALGNAVQRQRVLLSPLWEALGRSKAVRSAARWHRVLLVLGIASALVASLLFVPTPFYVSADGVLVPEAHKPVFSAVTAKVDRVLVEHGDEVRAGDALVVMSSAQHAYRIAELDSNLRNAQQRVTFLKDQRHRLDSEETAQEVQQQIVSLNQQISNLKEQRVLLDAISEDLIIKSPIDGRVITWDLKRRLEGRVVEPGIVLLEVADVAGSWRLELDLPIRRQGHVARALQSDSEEGLRVEYLCSTDPSRRLGGRLVGMDESVSLNESHEQVIKLRAAIDDSSDITIDQVRTGVTAKVYCGTSSLGFLWLHDLGEAFQKHVLFKLCPVSDAGEDRS